MPAPRLRALLASLAIAVPGLLLAAAASPGAAETGTFPIDDTFSDQVELPQTCPGGGATGAMSGTDTGLGRYTENGPPAFGFHDHAVVTEILRIDFDDGRYILASGSGTFDDNATTRDEFTSTGVFRDSGTLYDAAGDPLGTVRLLDAAHLAFRDTDGDHQPGPGEVSVDFHHFRLTCS
jgi:hypothetical protein